MTDATFVYHSMFMSCASKTNSTSSSKENSLAISSFPYSSVSKESACSAGDPGSIPGLGRSPGEVNGNPFQYPCLENLMDRGAWWAAVHWVAKSQAGLLD